MMLAKVEVASAAKYAQDVAMGRHAMKADEPERLGGADSGPAPYQILLASLGACTSITLRMYAEDHPGGCSGERPAGADPS